MTATTKELVDGLDLWIHTYTEWKDKKLLLETEEIKRRVIFYEEGLAYRTALNHIMRISGITNQEIFEIAVKALNDFDGNDN